MALSIKREAHPVPHSRQLRTDAVHVARRGVCSDLLTLTVDLGSAVKPQRAMQIGMCPRELPAHKAAAYPQRVVEQSEVGIGAVADVQLCQALGSLSCCTVKHSVTSLIVHVAHRVPCG